MTGSPPRASVVVTNFNYGAFVRAAVESALAQHGGGVEVIVVDDGSTDDSAVVLSSLRDRITLITQQNSGQGASFNVGFAASRGRVIFFLDADDVLHPDAVDRVVEAFDADPAVVRVQFQLEVIDTAGNPTGDHIPPRAELLTVGDVRRRLTTFPDDIPWQPTSGNAFRRDTLETILPMPTAEFRICADYVLSNLSCLSGTVAALQRPAASYRVHSRNHHFGSEHALAEIRANIVRTAQVHRLLIDACRRRGIDGLPDEPDDVPSVTALANRLVSARAAPGHPVPGDTRWRLLRLGISASAGRFDVSRKRRLLMAMWFVLMASVPRRTASFVADMFILPRSNTRPLPRPSDVTATSAR